MRSATATVRSPRCSTRRIATPRSRICSSTAKTVSTTVGDEPERRLVEQEHVGAGDERPGDRELLLLAPRERARLPGGELLDDGEEAAHPGEVVGDAVPCPPAREAEPQVLVDGERRKMWRPSGTSAMPARTIVLRLAAQRAAVQQDLAARPRDGADDRVQRRGLAGAVRPDQADDLAGVDLQAEAADGGDGAVADVELPHLERPARAQPAGLRPGAAPAPR